MNLRRSSGACNKPDTKDSIQVGLGHHDIVPGRYATIEQTIKFVERFKT